MRSLLVVIMLVSAASTVLAQINAADIRQMVAQVNAGNDEAVREQLPSLLSTYPNNPGVLYLQALLTREGADAVRTYQSIVDNFPQSEWADDALFKVYQFYYALGLYRTAELKLNQLRTSYPSSPFVAAAAADVPDVSTLEPAPPTQAPGTGSAKAPQVESGKPSTKAAEQPAQQPRQKPAEPVREKPKTTPSVSPAEPPPVHPEAAIQVRFSLQVGAFTQQANAESEKARFEAQGYSAELMSKVRDTRSLFIVLIGDYGTYEEAKAASILVKKKMGVDAIVISR